MPAKLVGDPTPSASFERFTPREVIRLMMNLLFIEDDDVLTPDTAVVRTIYDPTAGTGGMLSIAREHLLEYNPQARLTMYGQKLNDASYAICKADMLIKGNVALQSRPARCGRIFSCAQGHGRAPAPRVQLARQPHARARERIFALG